MLFCRVWLYFMTGFCVLGGVNGLLRDCSRSQVYLHSGGHVRVKLSGRAFDCRSGGRWFNSSCSLLHYHYNGLPVDRLLMF